jgi:hypothetical protein
MATRSRNLGGLVQCPRNALRFEADLQNVDRWQEKPNAQRRSLILLDSNAFEMLSER